MTVKYIYVIKKTIYTADGKCFSHNQKCVKRRELSVVIGAGLIRVSKLGITCAGSTIELSVL